jgi:hypothetical protein
MLSGPPLTATATVMFSHRSQGQAASSFCSSECMDQPFQLMGLKMVAAGPCDPQPIET